LFAAELMEQVILDLCVDCVKRSSAAVADLDFFGNIPVVLMEEQRRTFVLT
jgi:hypothetical protein